MTKNEKVPRLPEDLEDYLFDTRMATLRDKGISAKKVNAWTMDLANGNVPEGFESIDDFKQELRKRIDDD